MNLKSETSESETSESETESERILSEEVTYMAKKQHWQDCKASICADERCYVGQPKWKSEIPWYPGEPFCTRSPYTKWQKRQAKINRWHAKGEFRYGDKYYFTVEMLMRGKNVRKERKGGDQVENMHQKSILAV